MIPQQTIEQIKQRIDIVEVIGEFVDLKKSGTNYKGLSPFHDEKTPSFFVSPGKDIFKDFGSGQGGDAIKFIMEIEGLSYVEALKYLAQKYGIEISEKEETDEDRQNRTERESLFIVLNFAKDFYKDILLNHDEGKAIGLSYFKERGFTPEIINKFDLGYSLDQWDALMKEAEKKQYSLEILEKAGLVLSKDDGSKTYDRFRGRVTFPIHNLTGKVIAFGARILTNDKKQPKYINSPETEVYHKSKILYGISQAKQQIRGEDNCFLVEGYTDVLSMHQVGIENVVASSGTSLTVDQIKLIGRYTKNVTVLYDGDAAGIKASLRGIDLILEEGLNVNVVLIPEGEDPDSYARKLGGEKFREFVKKEKQDFITFKTKLFLSEAAGDPVKRAEVIKEIVLSVSKIPDAITRSVYLQQCARILDISEELLVQEFNSLTKKAAKKQSSQSDSGAYQYTQYDQPSPEDMALMAQAEMEAMEPTPVRIDEESNVIIQEREIARILLNYGADKLNDDSTVTQYLLAEIEDMESFYNELYGTIIKEFRAAQGRNEVIDASFFFEYEKEDVKQEVYSLISDPYSVSENWRKHQIFVKHEKDYLFDASYRTIMRLKWRNVRKMIFDNMQILTTSINPDEVDHVQTKHLHLKEFEMQIAKELGNVTIS